jgi:hypothetical protein
MKPGAAVIERAALRRKVASEASADGGPAAEVLSLKEGVLSTVGC